MHQYRYEMIARNLTEKIKSGEWEAGQMIPGEMELAKKYHVGRSTIREALNILQQKGLIDKKHGLGTFIRESKQRMDNSILTLSSIGRMIEDAGYEAGSVFYGVSYEAPDAEVKERLGLDAEDRVVIINRERTADGIPVAFSYYIFPEKLVGDMFIHGLSGSVFRLLREQCGIEIDHADTMIKGLDEERYWDAKALLYLKGPAVLMEQLHVDTKGKPIFFSYDYIGTNIMGLHIRRDINV